MSIWRTTSLQKTIRSPYEFCALVRQVVREIFLDKVRVPFLNAIYTKIKSVKADDVRHLNLYHDRTIPSEDTLIWK